MNAANAITPASVNSFATSPMRRMFSVRSSRLEAEVLVQPVADVVAVEHVGQAPALDQRRSARDRDRGLARARQPREPERDAALARAAARAPRASTWPACQVMLVALARPRASSRWTCGARSARPRGCGGERAPAGAGSRSAATSSIRARRGSISASVVPRPRPKRSARGPALGGQAERAQHVARLAARRGAGRAGREREPAQRGQQRVAATPAKETFRLPGRRCSRGRSSRPPGSPRADPLAEAVAERAPGAPPRRRAPRGTSSTARAKPTTSGTGRVPERSPRS